MNAWLFLGLAMGFAAAEAVQIILHRENLALLRLILDSVKAARGAE